MDITWAYQNKNEFNFKNTIFQNLEILNNAIWVVQYSKSKTY